MDDRRTPDADPPEGTEAHTGLDRRRFLGAAVATAGALTLTGRTVAFAEDALDPQITTTPEDVPQWVMVIDLARCDGCKECTKTCQETHWTGDQEWIKVFEVTDEAGGTVFLPRPCMQCENAPCLNVCPVGATFRNESGVVLVDHGICIGCRFCMAACPYDARSFNWGDPVNPPGATLDQYTPELPIPHRKGTVDKCMFCAHNAKDGKLPECASACPMSAIWFGDYVADTATNGLETVQLSWLLSSRDAYRLKEELGTRPRVWYLPGHGEHAKVVLPE